jgi:hypothetical protein
MSERRFSEEEVAEILKTAAEVQHSENMQLPSRSGLTLTELNEIGREVGISPEAVQQAVRRLDPTTQPTRRFLGLPIGVGRTVELDRTLSNEEWERLVVDLRQTFDARGVIRQEGSLRSWTNGNLQVLLEPTSTGQRLRLKTVKGSAEGLIGGGIAIFTAGAVLTVAALVKGVVPDSGLTAALTFLMGGGLVMFGAGAFSLPSWARRRRQQMDEIADRAANMEGGQSRLPDIPSS